LIKLNRDDDECVTLDGSVGWCLAVGWLNADHRRRTGSGSALEACSRTSRRCAIQINIYFIYFRGIFFENHIFLVEIQQLMPPNALGGYFRYIRGSRTLCRFVAVVGTDTNRNALIKPPLSATMLSICLLVCLSPKCKRKPIFSKIKQFRAMVSIDNL